jgi:hypothetical protein
MIGYRELLPGDTNGQEQLAQAALDNLARMATAMGPDSFVGDALVLPNSGNFYGVCVSASGAMTAAAHELGYAAARQLTVGGHCFTSFAAIEAAPTDEDLIGCMTLRQYDGARDSLGVDPNYPLGGAPFFGPRREAMRLTGDAIAYAASGVIFHQITYRPDPTNPELPRLWLMTSPDDVRTGQYPIGQADSDYAADRAWRSGYPEF